MKMPKEYKALLREAEAAGATVKKTKNGVMVFGPTGSTSIHQTPSVHRRSLENTRAQMRRAGIEV